VFKIQAAYGYKKRKYECVYFNRLVAKKKLFFFNLNDYPLVF